MIYWDISQRRLSKQGRRVFNAIYRIIGAKFSYWYTQLQKFNDTTTPRTDVFTTIYAVTHTLTSTSAADKSKSSSSDSTICCPLCQENFDGQEAMESHAMTAHSVNTEGLQRLQALMGASRKSPQSQKGRINTFILTCAHVKKDWGQAAWTNRLRDYAVMSLC